VRFCHLTTHFGGFDGDFDALALLDKGYMATKSAQFRDSTHFGLEFTLTRMFFGSLAGSLTQ